MPLLVVFSGVPGTGKSRLAEHAARRLDAVLLSKDIVEAALWRARIGAEQHSGWAAYEVMTALAEHTLGMGHAVVLDSVAKTESIRNTWRELALRVQAKMVIVECVLTDEAIHRARMDGRLRGIPGWPELTWEAVEAVRAGFAPWQDERLVLDAVRPLAENLQALDDYLARAKAAWAIRTP